MFSVDTEEEARRLIIAACPRDDRGTYYARELAHEQTLENLQVFSDKLARTWALMQERKRERAEECLQECAQERKVAQVAVQSRSRSRRVRKRD